jgi:aldose 1-epimerase
VEREGERCLHLETPYWHAEFVPGNNANLIRLFHVETGLEILRSPETLARLRRTPEHFGIPILFPPGRIPGGRFQWRNHEYAFPLNDATGSGNLNGILVGDAWDLGSVREESGFAEIRLSKSFGPDHPRFAGYPHPFCLELRYRFERDAVFQKTSLTNRGSTEMPFGLGYHTAFRHPGKGIVPRVWVSTDEVRWELSRESRLPTGHTLPLNPEERLCDFPGRKWDDSAMWMLCPMVTGSVGDRPLRGAWIRNFAPNVDLIYEVDPGYTKWAIWNDGGGHGFLCMEPLTWLSNAPNLPLPTERTGLSVLAPEETRAFDASIRVNSPVRSAGLTINIDRDITIP